MVAGLVGGICAGVVLAAGMNMPFSLHRTTALRGVAYGLAIVVPPELVVRYGSALTVGYGPV